VDRKDLQQLSRVRLREAKALLNVGFFDGAYYLAGYAVECALKACIAKETRRHEFPDKKRAESSYTHSLPALAKLAGLESERVERVEKDPVFQKHWEAVEFWTEQSRYRRHSPESARKLIMAINDKNHGIISWIRLHW
jgi:HEPN domain-containing protein